MKKKTGIAVAIVGLVAMAGSAMAWNGNYGSHHNGYNNGGYYNGNAVAQQNIDPAAQDAYFKATAELRTKYNGISAEYQALMNQANPDAQRARELGEEMSKVRSELRQKAEEAGLQSGYGYGYGHGGYGGMHGNGCW